MGDSDNVKWHPTNYRTHTLGEISSNGENFLGTSVTLCGFGEVIRGKGGVCFIKLRDGTGNLQAFIKKGNVSDEELEESQNASRESTFQITGEIAQKRPPKVPEGAPTPPPEYEIVADSVNILSIESIISFPPSSLTACAPDSFIILIDDSSALFESP